LADRLLQKITASDAGARKYPGEKRARNVFESKSKTNTRLPWYPRRPRREPSQEKQATSPLGTKKQGTQELGDKRQEETFCEKWSFAGTKGGQDRAGPPSNGGELVGGVRPRWRGHRGDCSPLLSTKLRRGRVSHSVLVGFKTSYKKWGVMVGTPNVSKRQVHVLCSKGGGRGNLSCKTKKNLLRNLAHVSGEAQRGVLEGLPTDGECKSTGGDQRRESGGARDKRVQS